VLLDALQLRMISCDVHSQGVSGLGRGRARRTGESEVRLQVRLPQVHLHAGVVLGEGGAAVQRAKVAALRLDNVRLQQAIDLSCSEGGKSMILCPFASIHSLNDYNARKKQFSVFLEGINLQALELRW